MTVSAIVTEDTSKLQKYIDQLGKWARKFFFFFHFALTPEGDTDGGVFGITEIQCLPESTGIQY